MRFFRSLSLAGAGWLAGVLSGLTTPNGGPITSRLQAAGCWLAVWLAGRLLELGCHPELSGVTRPNGGPITSTLQDCWLLAGALAGWQAAGW